MLERIKEISTRILAAWGGELLEFNGKKDHIHLLISIPPKVAPSAMVNNLKTMIARLIRKECSDHMAGYNIKPAFWYRFYCIITCCGAPLSVIKQNTSDNKEMIDPRFTIHQATGYRRDAVRGW
jgi:putative transposase